MPFEVPGPAISPGIEQTSQLSRGRVTARQVAGLGEIARRASQREILESSLSPMLARDNVFDVKRQHIERLRYAAILAATARAAPHFNLQRGRRSA